MWNYGTIVTLEKRAGAHAPKENDMTSIIRKMAGVANPRICRLAALAVVVCPPMYAEGRMA